MNLKDEFTVQFEILKEQAEEKERKYQQNKLELDEVVAQNNVLQRSLFEMKSKYEVTLQAREAEIDMATTELERMAEEVKSYKKQLVR